MAGSNLTVDTSNGELCDFSNQPLSCPSTSGSFSSGSSFYDTPFTPRSGRSTPQNHMHIADFDGSFGGSSNSSSSIGNPVYDYTPPSSASSSFFPVNARDTCSTPDLFGGHGMPITPTSYNHMPDSSMALHDSMSMTPSQSLGIHNFSSPLLDSSPYAMPTPMHSFYQTNSLPSDTQPSIWHEQSLSPVTFMDTLSSPSTMIKSLAPNRTIVSPSRPGAHLANNTTHIQQTSAALQKVQENIPMMVKAKQRKARNAAVKAQCLKESGIQVNKDQQTRQFCEYPGCTKSYCRKEHMKRHMRKHFPEACKRYVCDFCPMEKGQPKIIQDRQDNFRTHLVLHTTDRSGKRTKYAPRAQAAIDRLDAQSKTDHKKGKHTKGSASLSSIPSRTSMASASMTPLYASTGSAAAAAVVAAGVRNNRHMVSASLDMGMDLKMEMGMNLKMELDMDLDMFGLPPHLLTAASGSLAPAVVVPHHHQQQQHQQQQQPPPPLTLAMAVPQCVTPKKGALRMADFELKTPMTVRHADVLTPLLSTPIKLQDMA